MSDYEDTDDEYEEEEKDETQWSGYLEQARATTGRVLIPKSMSTQELHVLKAHMRSKDYHAVGGLMEHDRKHKELQFTYRSPNFTVEVPALAYPPGTPTDEKERIRLAYVRDTEKKIEEHETATGARFAGQTQAWRGDAQVNVLKFKK